jgi:two-component system nitrate/nitrite response regulator NarL
MQDTIPILIADDHVLLAEAVGAVLSREYDFSVNCTNNLDDALAKLENSQYQIILLDVMMPGMDGLKSISQVINSARPGKVVLFSGGISMEFAHKALALGASGFIPKTLPLKSLPSALRLVVSGQIFLPVTIDEVKLNARCSRERERNSLSELQSDILRLVRDGKTNKEIAREISGTETSVKMHLRAVFSKLEAKNRVHAVNIAQSIGLL